MDLDFGEVRVSKKIIEFLEVAIHNIAYTRHLYPSSSFASKQKYGTPVRICNHPGVSGYIKNCLKGVEELFNTNEIEKVHLVLLQENSDPLESFVFNFLNSNTSTNLEDFSLKESIELFQVFCLKLGTSHSHVNPRNVSKSFRIEIITTTPLWQSIVHNSGDKNFTWYEAKRSMEKLNSLEARICPSESFRTNYLSAHNVIYTNNTSISVKKDSE